MKIGNRPFDFAQDRLPATGNSKTVKVCCFAVCALLLCALLPRSGQPAKKIPRIGFLAGHAKVT